MKKLPSSVWFLMRFGVAFTFLYASVSAFIDPIPWLGYFPPFLREMFSDNFLLATWGTGEFIIGIWLISGYQIFIPSVLSSILLIGIFVFDFHTHSITFRNVSILCTSVGIAILSWQDMKMWVREQRKKLHQEELNNLQRALLHAVCFALFFIIE